MAAGWEARPSRGCGAPGAPRASPSVLRLRRFGETTTRLLAMDDTEERRPSSSVPVWLGTPVKVAQCSTTEKKADVPEPPPRIRCLRACRCRICLHQGRRRQIRLPQACWCRIRRPRAHRRRHRSSGRTEVAWRADLARSDLTGGGGARPRRWRDGMGARSEATKDSTAWRSHSKEGDGQGRQRRCRAQIRRRRWREPDPTGTELGTRWWCGISLDLVRDEVYLAMTSAKVTVVRVGATAAAKLQAETVAVGGCCCFY